MQKYTKFIPDRGKTNTYKMLWTRGFDADPNPDPSFYLKADPEKTLTSGA